MEKLILLIESLNVRIQKTQKRIILSKKKNYIKTENLFEFSNVLINNYTRFTPSFFREEKISSPNLNCNEPGNANGARESRIRESLTRRKFS